MWQTPKMIFKILVRLYLSFTVLCSTALSHELKEMIDKGKVQYQLLQERGNLPKYGSCWKQAIRALDEGCGTLTEETQGDLALNLANCFLDMSGHDIYNCAEDRKPNVRRICVSTMTDRAFNVYTEFYTHAQNICWFLRGQVWHETVAENTVRIGRVLETSAHNLNDLMVKQERSLAMQERLLRHGNALEKILEEFLTSTKQHQELLSVMGASLASLQAWLMGEVSWFDTLIFYVSSAILIIVFTSHPRTSASKLPILILLALNILIERFICSKLANSPMNNIKEIHLNYDNYIWIIRYIFMIFSALAMCSAAYFYTDYTTENHKILSTLRKEMLTITQHMNKSDVVTTTLNGVRTSLENNSFRISSEKNTPTDDNSLFLNQKASIRENLLSSNNTPKKPLKELYVTRKYNLRSRQGTPDTNVV